MKKFLATLLTAILALTCVIGLTACKDKPAEKQTLLVYTNAGFPPYEYLTTTGEVAGVDIDIMNELGKRLGYNVVINDIDFNLIPNEVQGNVLAVGAAGMTKTDERDAVMQSSIVYATSIQYAIVAKGTFTENDLTDGKLDIAKLAGKKIGVQEGTTGDFMVADALAEATDETEAGALYNTNASKIDYPNAIIASQDIASTAIDAVVIDKLPAEKICSSDSNLECFELKADPESYVLYFNKSATDLVAKVNAELEKMIAEGLIAQYTVNHSSN